MATILQPHEYIDRLCCPPPCKGRLYMHDGSFCCRSCGNIYPIRHEILELIIPEKLDSEKTRELKGNTFNISDEKVMTNLSAKDLWSEFYSFFHLQKIHTLIRMMEAERIRSFASLGSGCGFETKMILQRCAIEEVLCSDLS